MKLNGLTEQEAEAASGKITAAGGKMETHIVATGADISRGWGLRHSVAEDFLYDDLVQLGSLRVGPDLAASVRVCRMRTGSCSIFTRREVS